MVKTVWPQHGPQRYMPSMGLRTAGLGGLKAAELGEQHTPPDCLFCLGRALPSSGFLCTVRLEEVDSAEAPTGALPLPSSSWLCLLITRLSGMLV